MRVALVQKERQAELRRERDLRLEPAVLHGPGREVAVVVEPALADGDHLGARRERAELLDGRFAAVLRVVRVYARRREQAAGIRAREISRFAAPRDARARHDHRSDARRRGALDHVLAVALERAVAEVDSNVDKFGWHDFSYEFRFYSMNLTY